MRLRTLLLAAVFSLIGLQPTWAVDCGAARAPACGPKQWCSYAADNACGVQGKPGVCTPSPQICTREYMPVCGCDGKTYSNACGAHASGASIAYVGSCRPLSGAVTAVPKHAERICTQGIACGIKNGAPKEYANTCAAEDDGATNIALKSGSTCPAVR